MRRAILPVSLGLAGLALSVWLVWMIFESQRQDVAIARAFLTHVAAQELTQAGDLMTPALATRIGPRGLQPLFGEIEAWDHIGFSSRSTNTAQGVRRTELRGTGTALSGCESLLRMVLVDGLVDAFNVTPLCPAADVAA